MKLIIQLILLFGFIHLTSCQVKPTKPVIVNDKTLTTETVLTQREIIWGMDFLDSSTLIFTERKGKISIFKDNIITECSNVPVVSAQGQGGMLDLKKHPNFTQNGWIYISYSQGNDSGTKLVLSRFKLNNSKIVELQVLFETPATNTMLNHYGSRIAFDDKNKLWLSIGEGGDTSQGGADSPNKNAQNLAVPWGKIHRLNDDGTIPADNPVFDEIGKVSSIFSYGHRNPQGICFDPFKNKIYATEHGPQGGDELNEIVALKNYGWPLVSYGVNYGGGLITKTPSQPVFQDPIHYYVPSIGTSSLAVISGEHFESWKGQYLVGGLAKQYLSKVELKEGKFLKETKLLENIGRVRQVIIGPDGYIYVSVENPGRILKLSLK